MRKIKLPSRATLLLNGAAIVVGVASLGAVLRATFVSVDTPTCKERFASATRFSLERNGALVTVEDLQGQSANSDWGLSDGARAIKLKSGPATHALELDLASVPSVSRDGIAERAGLGFTWAPQSFRKPETACLTYSVFVPEGFTFGRGGRLPGLSGASFDTDEASDGQKSEFSTRYTWSNDGALDVLGKFPGWSEARAMGVGASGRGIAMKPGQWTELEQEIVLNTPGKNNGILRVWQDGKLVVNKKDIVFRIKASVSLGGVLAEAAAGELPGGTRRGAQKIWLTPFELRWQ